MRRRRFPVMLSLGERQALQALAKADGLSGSAVVRRLVRHEARKRGLWSPPDTAMRRPAGEDGERVREMAH